MRIIRKLITYRAALFLFTAILILPAILLVVSLSPLPDPLRFSENNVTGTVTVSRTSVFPKACVNFQWKIEGFKELYFNDLGVAHFNSSEQCNFNDVSARWRIVAQDGTVSNHAMTVPMLSSNLALFTLFAAIMLLTVLFHALFTKTIRPALFIASSLIVAAVPLLLLRSRPLSLNTAFVAVIYGLEIGLCVFGMVALRKAYPRQLVQTAVSSSVNSPYKRSFYTMIGLCGLLLVCTVVMFDVPLHKHFWAGADEGTIFMTRGRPLWSVVFDQIQSRPLNQIQTSLAFILSPNSADGFLWITTLLRLLSALLVFAITSRLLRKFTPFARLIAVAAAVLFIVEPSEVSRFLVVFTWPYAPSVFFLLFATWLYLESYYRKQLWGLILACGVLGLALLDIETGILVAIAIPILLLVVGRRPHTWLWVSTWYSIVLLCGLRLTAFLLNSASAYQTSIVATRSERISTIVTNVGLQLSGFVDFLRIPAARGDFWLYGVFAAGLAFLLFKVLFPHREAAQSEKSQVYVIGLCLTLPIMLLAFGLYLFVPISPITDFANNPTWRMRFFAAPIIAISWALIIGLIGNILLRQPKYLAKYFYSWVIGATCVLVVIAVASAMQFQENGGFITRRVSYDLMRSIYRQIHALKPDLAPDSGILFILDDDEESPLGYNYFLFDMTCLVLHTPAYQGTFEEDGFLPRTKNTTLLTKPWGNRLVFDRAAAFHVNKDGIVTSVPIPPVKPSAITAHEDPKCENLVTAQSLWPPDRFWENLAQ